MAGPGKGRYTTYVPIKSTKNTLLRSLFNERAPNGQGTFYGDGDVSNDVAAAAALARATAPVVNGVGGLIPSDGNQVGDMGMFSKGVDLHYRGSKDAPEQSPPQLNEVKWTKAGDPAFGYVPDISSPGPGRATGLQKDVDPKLSVNDIKPNYTAGAPDTGTTSPAVTSPKIAGSFGDDMEMGKSSK